MTTQWAGSVRAERLASATGVRVIPIDHAPRNLLNPGVLGQLTKALEDADADETVTGIVLTGSGDVFCGGLDVPAIQAGADPVEFAEALVELLRVMPKLGTPVAAAVNGDAVASGASLVASADFAVAHVDCRIGTYEVSVGIWPMIAQVPLISRIGARAAMENVGSGEPFSADRAREVGLVQGIVPSASLVEACVAWLENASRGGSAYAAGRRSLYEFAGMSHDEALLASLDRFTSMFR